MITRVWHGWTTPANAPKFEALLEEEIFVGIARREIPGYHGVSLWKKHEFEHGFKERQELVEVIARLRGRGAVRNN